jgi:hypothetical protein
MQPVNKVNKTEINNQKSARGGAGTKKLPGPAKGKKGKANKRMKG